MASENKQTWQILVVDSEQCTGCEICENVCSITHYEVFNPKFSRIHRVRVEPIINTTIACLRCDNPECVTACDMGALTQNPLTGTIEVDDNLCDACGSCVRACPFGAITIHPEVKKAITCDLCESVEEATPQCVRYCPKSAIHILDIDSDNEENRQITLANFVKKGFAQPKDANKNTMRAEHREYT